MQPTLNISNLTIGYHRQPLIETINLSATKGSLVSIIGRNGEGKTTLLKTIASLLAPINGTISVDGKSIEHISEKEKSKLISLVLTHKIGIHHITVFDYIAYGRYPYTNWLGIQSNRDHGYITDAIELCGVAHLANQYFTELSDGEKQKVNIARAIAQNTPVIILDEPTAHLDLVNKIEVFKLLKKLADEHQKTIVISTHQIDLALQLSNSIWLMVDQQIIQDEPSAIIKSGSIHKLFNSKDIVFNPTTNSFTLP